MNKTLKIVITGAESTGKSTLTKILAKHFNGNFIPEYAREYVEKLNRKYNYKDLLIITEKQIELEKKYINKKNKIIFIDTSFFIIKIWFEVVFNKKPIWFDKILKENIADLYLLCNNEIEWKPDKVRENGNKKRDLLFLKYEKELKKYNANYKIISGKNNTRTSNAIQNVEKLLTLNSQFKQH